MGLDVPTNSWCSRYLDPQWGSPGTQLPCFGAERHLWDLNAKGSLCIHYWSIPCGQLFSSSNRANEVWLKSIDGILWVIYYRGVHNGHFCVLCEMVVCCMVNGGAWLIYNISWVFYFVVQQSIIVQSIYYWNVCILVHCLEVSHKLLGSVYGEIDWFNVRQTVFSVWIAFVCDTLHNGWRTLLIHHKPLSYFTAFACCWPKQSKTTTN